jgi:hypothetical protein
MTNYVGQDVSQKTTSVVDGDGHRLWRGECISAPEQIPRVVMQSAGLDASPLPIASAASKAPGPNGLAEGNAAGWHERCASFCSSHWRCSHAIANGSAHRD